MYLRPRHPGIARLLCTCWLRRGFHKCQSHLASALAVFLATGARQTYMYYHLVLFFFGFFLVFFLRYSLSRDGYRSRTAELHSTRRGKGRAK